MDIASESSEGGGQFRPAATGASKVVKSLDLFSVGMPSFNMGGKTQVRTIAGGLMSMTMFAILLSYATLKFQHLLLRWNPQVTRHVDESAFVDGQRLDLNDNDFTMAFGIEHYIDGLKID